MGACQVQQVRRFNRIVTQRVGALEDSYLSRGRPLGEARLLFETGTNGADVRALRNKLGLDSGYLSRLLRSLEAQGLVVVHKQTGDGRLRRVSLTPEGQAEFATYDRLSDDLAESMLTPLGPAQRDRLVNAMAEVERLIRAAAVEVRVAGALRNITASSQSVSRPASTPPAAIPFATRKSHHRRASLPWLGSRAARSGAAR